MLNNCEQMNNACFANMLLLGTTEVAYLSTLVTDLLSQDVQRTPFQ